MIYFISGLILGLTAGISPGPLLALVLTETMRHGLKAGIRVSLVPLLTDIPIVALCLLVMSNIAGSPGALGIISLAGAVFVVYLGIDTFMSSSPGETDTRGSGSLRKGIVTNMLSPHPYLFWMTVGSATVLKASLSGIYHAAAFIAGFYLFLVGSKLLIAFLTSRTSHLLYGRGYKICMRTLGTALMMFAVILAKDAFYFLGFLD